MQRGKRKNYELEEKPLNPPTEERDKVLTKVKMTGIFQIGCAKAKNGGNWQWRSSS